MSTPRSWREEQARWIAKYADPARPFDETPAPFVVDSLAFLRAAGLPSERLAPALDLAMGEGANALHLARNGWSVVGLDLATNAVARLNTRARADGLPLSSLVADALHPPFRPGSFGLLLCIRFLERSLSGELQELLAPGGVLLFETFTTEQRQLGWGPKDPDFLLEPDELRHMFPALSVLSYQEGRFGSPCSGRSGEAAVARLIAVRS